MRRWLILYGTALSAALLLALLVPVGLLSRRLAEDRALGQARQEAQNVAVIAAVADLARLEVVVDSVNSVGAGDVRRTTVFLPDGRQIGAPAEPSDSTRLAATGSAFTAATSGGREVLIPVAGPDGPAVVRTFVPSAVLHQGVAAALGLLAALGGVLMALAVAAAWRIASSIAGPVSKLQIAADQLADGDLSATVEPEGPPEVVAVGRAMNRLGSRITELLTAERELVADLSHRLRTPVTALRLDVDGLRDPVEAERLGEHVDALESSVTAVIGIARGPLRHQPRSTRCDAALVVGERARFWQVLAEDQHRAMHVVLPERDAPVEVDSEELAAAVDALIENVFAHTPDGTALTVLVTCSSAGPRPVVEIAVADAGPGISDLDLARRGASGGGSTGLGMDIARRTAVAAGGELLVGPSSVGGASVALHLPEAR